MSWIKIYHFTVTLLFLELLRLILHNNNSFTVCKNICKVCLSLQKSLEARPFCLVLGWLIVELSNSTNFGTLPIRWRLWPSVCPINNCMPYLYLETKWSKKEHCFKIPFMVELSKKMFVLKKNQIWNGLPTILKRICYL